MKIKGRINIDDAFYDFEVDGTVGELAALPNVIGVIKTSMKYLVKNQ